MRLLNSFTGEMEEFITDRIPPYAILSHTWGKDEVTFKQWEETPSCKVESRQGYDKIKHCCRQACEDGLEWVWVDTCCIDKTSSAELSEAINSMFRWYQNAKVCYVYLADVSSIDSDVISAKLATEISKSRWFTRGWTLQELLAPKTVEFYSKQWHYLGTRMDLLTIIEECTGIKERFLGGSSLKYASISNKMSWASKRQTSRIEDVAYCLMGIFDVNMPLLYGEGKKAFKRLQEEIMRTYPRDHTLFAWGALVVQSNMQTSHTATDIQWDNAAANQPLYGLLAESPKDFIASGSFKPWDAAASLYAQNSLAYPTAIGTGISLELHVNPSPSTSVVHWRKPKLVQILPLAHARLLCGPSNHKGIWIPLQPWGEGFWGRRKEIVLDDHPFAVPSNASMKSLLHIEPESKISGSNGDIIIRSIDNGPCTWHSACPALRVHYIENQRVIRPNLVASLASYINDETLAVLKFRLPAPHEHLGFGLALSRSRAEHTISFSHALMSISLVPLWFGIEWSGSQGNEIQVYEHNMIWLWHLDEKIFTSNSMLKRTMQAPVDIWELDVEPLPLVHVKVERKALVNDLTSLEVLDIRIDNRSIE